MSKRKGGVNMMVRQGDLLIVKVKALPEGCRKKGHRVLAEGEATGHKHELDSGELYEKNGTLYFKISDHEKATLQHQEHGPVTFDPGTYKVVRQREYVPKGWRPVVD
jgi:hypothetical protein